MQVAKIALEEHVADPNHFDPQFRLKEELADIHGRLLGEMDAAGIQMSVLSLKTFIQGIPERKEAIDTARRANDYLAEQVTKNPRRFQAFAALPLQDPEAAALELSRCVQQLGFRGALVNGFSQVDNPNTAVYLDEPRYLDFWATVERLDVPFYLHPRDPLPGWMPILDGHPWFETSRYAFTVETATHALRLMASGVFDRYPKLAIVLGHLGETLPNQIWRIDHRIDLMPPKGIPAKKKLGEYLRNNFYITTSGNFCTPTLLNAIQWMGAERILFSVDYPFEKMKEAADWFDRVDAISQTDWDRIARQNAVRLLKLED